MSLRILQKTTLENSLKLNLFLIFWYHTFFFCPYEVFFSGSKTFFTRLVGSELISSYVLVKRRFWSYTLGMRYWLEKQWIKLQKRCRNDSREKIIKYKKWVTGVMHLNWIQFLQLLVADLRVDNCVWRLSLQ